VHGLLATDITQPILANHGGGWYNPNQQCKGKTKMATVRTFDTLGYAKFLAEKASRGVSGGQL